jgi:hypothetical protein
MLVVLERFDSVVHMGTRWEQDTEDVLDHGRHCETEVNYDALSVEVRSTTSTFQLKAKTNGNTYIPPKWYF